MQATAGVARPCVRRATARVTNGGGRSAESWHHWPALMFSRITNRLRRTLAYLHPREVRFRRDVARRDARYDAENGVDTSSVADLKSLTIDSANRPHAVAHIATDPKEFARAMAALPIRHQEFTFVDLGSGKGRALLLAHALPFRRLVGVEFALELHEVAKANLRGSVVELLCMDATAYDFPAGPLVVFLYNPFGPEIMGKIAHRLKAHSGPLYVVYINPFHVQPWLACGFRIVARGEPFAILERSPPPE
jgi:SAM-dependent methyltransferase